jgi:hypothetical protein
MPPKHPVVIAYHLVWTVYGTWLPNDPRGSGSLDVAAPELLDLGELHFGRRKRQPPPSAVREFYARAEPRLRFPVIRFDTRQIGAVGAAFGDCIKSRGYTCYACAILPDHAHLVIRKHRDRAEDMIDHLQESSRLRLSKEKLIPAAHPAWTLGGYRRFLDAPEHVRTVVRYVEQNLVRAALPAQPWPYIQPYDGWPFHKHPR